MSARILVIGAGLGGLTTALALRKAGFAVEVHEAAPQLGEVGAGLTVSRGAQSVFRHIGVQDEVARFSTPSSGFPFLHYRTGALLAGTLDHGIGLPDDGTADVSRQCHRADLHGVLATAFGGPLHLDHRLVGIEETAHGVRARFADGSSAEGDALIAADGVRSIARSILWGETAPRFTGQMAYRFLVGRPFAEPFLEHGRGAVFLGPQRTFNRYTLRSGQVINCVGIAATDAWVDEGWSTPATRDELQATFAGWQPSVTGMMGVAERLIKWGIFDHAPLPAWSKGRVTLLGDAAHAMLPFLGMGAAMAIEDAMVLARALEAERDVAPAFARYEAARIPRTTLIQAKSVEQGILTQARNPDDYRHTAAPAADPAIMAYDPVTAVM
ncbi:FAD-dependent monooxygenase [Sphingomonas sp. UYEF23]|uniref:FAD-dependent monooxygenase n=1 Tax=Sphingomonas sp. UYEF23 TaxID=1756408 RepID=UPI00339AAAE6